MALRGPNSVWAVACVAGCAGAGLADVRTVYVYDFAYSTNRPGEGEIESPQIFVGDTIRWEWLSDFHDVVAVPGQVEQWQSPLFTAGDSFEHTFANPGVYWYYCTPHGFALPDGTAGGMSSIVEVLPVPSAGTLVLAALGIAVAAPLRRRA